MKIKTGIGFDAHRFDTERPLILGGIEVPSEAGGLAGHSDADVLIHAVIDALVGPTLATDIGGLFPDTDPKYKNIDSKILLKEAINRIADKGYTISNVDVQVIAQVPRLKPYIEGMRTKLAEVMEIDIEDITIKATTTEKMGFTGRKEGIAALATACLIQI